MTSGPPLPRVHARAALKDAERVLRDVDARFDRGWLPLDDKAPPRRRRARVWAAAAVWYLGCLLVWLVMSGRLDVAAALDLLKGALP